MRLFREFDVVVMFGTEPQEPRGGIMIGKAPNLLGTGRLAKRSLVHTIFAPKFMTGLSMANKAT